MALCESKIFTDSGDLNGADSIQELLDGKRSRKREGKTSPRLGKRRSSRIRKRGAADDFSDGNCDSSDDSDPNIQLGDNVLMDEEEKIMIKEESDLVNNQSAEKQLLAVALVRSVIDSKLKPDDIKKEAMRKKDIPDDEILKSVNNINDPPQVKKEVNQSVDSTHMQNNNPGDYTNNVQPKIEEEVVENTNLGANPAIDSQRQSVQPPEVNSTLEPPNTNNKISTQRNTRSRSKSAKGGRTMALKGAYASIREAPRVVRKPNVTTIPVPNPILPSPVTTDLNKANVVTEINPVLKMDDMIQGGQGAPTQNQQQQQTQNHNATKSSLANLTQNNVATTKPTAPNAAVACAIPARCPSNTNSNPTPQQATRRRIFSIDFDTEGFDFDMNMGVTCTSPSPSADIVDSISALPPIISSSSVIEKKNTSAPITSNQPTSISMATEDSTMPTATRDRGMSFELFSFAHNDTLPSDPVDLNEEALNGGRPRGDSIIFDPVSFSDGNEEAAFQRLQQHSAAQHIQRTQIDLMNTPALDNCSSQFQNNVQPQKIQSHHTVASTKPLSTQQPSRSRTSHSRVSKSTRSSVGGSYLRHSKSSSTSSKSKTIHFSGNHFPHSDDTIHMPQGSAAAAAAAASLSSQVVPYSMNGTISHTACPMELLNKGGRIGIYLPEARRERIAKFHSKRKNRIWRKRIKYDCRKKLADSRPRIKGRFVKSLEE